jgi:DNA modification methylase
MLKFNSYGFKIICGDARSALQRVPDRSVRCCVTSPPYFGLRDYGHKEQIGLEVTPEKYVENLVAVFREVRRCLRSDGTLWLNLGDSYAGSGKGGNPESGTKQGTNVGSQTVGVLYGRENKKEERDRVRKAADGIRLSGVKAKDLIGIPWMVAFALRADGWYLRSDIIWHKPNAMPSSVTDRCTAAHEYLFMLSKEPTYYYDSEAICEPRNYPNDKRRPLGSKGAWEMDGREQGANGGGKPYDQSQNKRGGKSAFRGAGHFRDGKGPANREGRDMSEIGTGPTRNRRSVWSVNVKGFKGAHFATFPEALITPPILAGSKVGDTILDPFSGAGTTGVVARRLKRYYIGCELNLAYVTMSVDRIMESMEKETT